MSGVNRSGSFIFSSSARVKSAFTLSISPFFDLVAFVEIQVN